MSTAPTAPDLDAAPQAYYVPLGGGDYRPTLHAQGAWQSHEQHMAPVSGLLVHCLEAFEPSEHLQIARITFDILGMIGADVTHVECRTLRPGRTIRLDEAVASVGGRPVVRATVWRLATADTTPIAGGGEALLPGPDQMPEWPGMTSRWAGGFIASLGARTDTPGANGSGRFWIRQSKTIVEGEESTPLASYVAVVDAMNGVAPHVEPVDWMFPNTDLTIHLHRPPSSARWVGLATSVTVGASGLGVTSAVLHDTSGPIGRAEQILTVRPMPGR
ncbi:thioesterase family protein [Agilicoccus flavus]|uniref:thioesterase family protein n=1 Tax=Agilicoccus flavus TaxID=2775968 RepID=UPI001CF6734B|nr:thioesterase family protein [Agilicoccus flavus]